MPTAITAGFLDLAWLLLYPFLYVFQFFCFFGSLEPLKLFKSSFVFLAVLFFGSFVFLAVLFFGSLEQSNVFKHFSSVYRFLFLSSV